MQVSGGAYPRFARTGGRAEVLADATTLRPSCHQIFHDDRRPSALVLPVCPVPHHETSPDKPPARRS
ncbi:hypothetical protein AB0G64_36885 [Streptomyces longwoodensis]